MAYTLTHTLQYLKKFTPITNNDTQQPSLSCNITSFISDEQLCEVSDVDVCCLGFIHTLIFGRCDINDSKY